LNAAFDSPDIKLAERRVWIGQTGP